MSQGEVLPAAALERKDRPITNFIQTYFKTTNADRAQYGLIGERSGADDARRPHLSPGREHPPPRAFDTHAATHQCTPIHSLASQLDAAVVLVCIAANRPQSKRAPQSKQQSS